MNATPRHVFSSLYAFADAGADGIVCMTLTLRACDEATERYRWYLQTLAPFAADLLPKESGLTLELSR